MYTVIGKKWYDGFTFGNRKDIYNPWSILNYLDTGRVGIYWANTSSNSLIEKLIREGSSDVKIVMEDLLNGKAFHGVIEEQIVFNQLGYKTSALWSLLLASAFLKGNLKEMNLYMNKVALNTISYFDTEKRPSGREPERFYHGLVLSLLVELYDKYTITSNRESGYGRYDVIAEPQRVTDPAMILEFKVREPEEESSLEETADAALKQIEEKKYEQILMEKGIQKERIYKYGFAFEGKCVLIKQNR